MSSVFSARHDVKLQDYRWPMTAFAGGLLSRDGRAESRTRRVASEEKPRRVGANHASKIGRDNLKTIQWRNDLRQAIKKN
jgi:hypothetical protein